MGYRGTQSQPQNPTQTTINIIKEHLMPDKEEVIPTLIRSQHRRFIEEQKEIIREIIRDFSPEREVFYTFFATPKIVIYEIIFDQRGTDFLFYIRNLPEGTFTRLRGERDDIPEGPPQYDSDGHEIYTDEESDYTCKYLRHKLQIVQ